MEESDEDVRVRVSRRPRHGLMKCRARQLVPQTLNDEELTSCGHTTEDVSCAISPGKDAGGPGIVRTRLKTGVSARDQGAPSTWNQIVSASSYGRRDEVIDECAPIIHPGPYPLGTPIFCFRKLGVRMEEGLTSYPAIDWGRQAIGGLKGTISLPVRARFLPGEGVQRDHTVLKSNSLMMIREVLGLILGKPDLMNQEASFDLSDLMFDRVIAEFQDQDFGYCCVVEEIQLFCRFLLGFKCNDFVVFGLIKLLDGTVPASFQCCG
ncbi:hypothetical protein NPIL_281671 [Nephila pilipes]|uniref:Uncharacterized protein n=1 Tax=Nephila pilipes TaxID=299642 RepID=A0A8X6PAY0_NEPPI|nr:hypothetical protein NPIL_281671 [Nephila pilipes]